MALVATKIHLSSFKSMPASSSIGPISAAPPSSLYHLVMV